VSRLEQRKEEVNIGGHCTDSSDDVCRRTGDECPGFSVCGGDARPRGPRGNE